MNNFSSIGVTDLQTNRWPILSTYANRNLKYISGPIERSVPLTVINSKKYLNSLHINLYYYLVIISIELKYIFKNALKFLQFINKA